MGSTNYEVLITNFFLNSCYILLSMPNMFQNPILQHSQPFCSRNAASSSAPLQNNRESYNFNIYLSIVNEKTNDSGLNSNRNSPNNLTWSLKSSCMQQLPVRVPILLQLFPILGFTSLHRITLHNLHL